MSVRLIIAKYDATSHFIVPEGVFLLSDDENATLTGMNVLGEHYIKWDTLYYVASLQGDKPVIKQIQGQPDEGERKRPDRVVYTRLEYLADD
jgi:hypothetical protein